MTVREFVSGEKGRTPQARREALSVLDEAWIALEALWDCSGACSAEEPCERCEVLDKLGRPV